MSINVQVEAQKIVDRHLAEGVKTVFRDRVFAILWYNYGIIGKALTRKIMQDIATATGGVYVFEEGKGRARIVY